MKRFAQFAAAAALLAVVIGCSPGGSAPGPAHRVGSGSLNASYNDSISLATGTVFGPAHYIGSIDTVSLDFYASTGTAACTPTIEVANGRYNPSTSSPTDDSLWDTYAPSGWTAPAAISGAVSNYYIEIVPIGAQYIRPKFVCTSGTTTLTVTTQMKGG